MIDGGQSLTPADSKHRNGRGWRRPASSAAIPLGAALAHGEPVIAVEPVVAAAGGQAGMSGELPEGVDDVSWCDAAAGVVVGECP